MARRATMRRAMVPKPYFLRIDHLGIAVPSLGEAVPLYSALMGAEPEHFEEVPDQRVRTAFFSLGESHLELLEPTHDDSPIAGFLAKGRKGIHHLCVAVRDLDGLLAATFTPGAPTTKRRQA